MPDITLLVPLADVLEVTVTELLECKRIEKTDSLDADRTDEIVKKVITLSEEELDLFRMNRKKRLLFFVPVIAFACVETILLQIWAHLQSIPADNLYLFALVGILCGCYFWVYKTRKYLISVNDDLSVGAYVEGKE